MKIRTLLAALLATSVMASQSMAAVQVGDAQFEESAAVAGSTLKLSGAGMRTKVFFKVYAAGLYLNGAAASLDAIAKLPAPMRVRLVMARDVGAKTFVDALVEGLADNTPEATRKHIQSEIDALVACMNRIGDVKTGDVIDFDFTDANKTAVYVNKKLIDQNLGGRDLYMSVLGIWLGPKAIDSGLKSAMLGAK